MTANPIGEVCRDCKIAKTNKHHGVYKMTCIGCRERLLMDEPCKLMRKITASMLAKWGDVPDWKKDPSCGCGIQCKRRQLQDKG